MGLHVQSEGGVAVDANHQRISVVNIELGAKKCFADLQERLRTLRQLNDEQVAFRYRQARLLKNLQGSLRIAQDNADDSAIGGIDDGERHDADIGRLETADHV